MYALYTFIFSPLLYRYFSWCWFFFSTSFKQMDSNHSTLFMFEVKHESTHQSYTIITYERIYRTSKAVILFSINYRPDFVLFFYYICYIFLFITLKHFIFITVRCRKQRRNVNTANNKNLNKRTVLFREGMRWPNTAKSK